MATLDRQIPSPHTFLCKPWSSFVSAVPPRLVDNPSLESNDRETLSQNQAPKLGKQEMFVYGQFPALEDFCLVVCNVCKQVVTPQGILAHYEKRHSSPGPSRVPLVPMKPKAPAAPVAPCPGSGDTLAFRVPKDYPHSRFNKAPLAVYPPKGARNKTCVSLPVVTLEKIPCLSRVDGASRVRLTSSSSASPSSLKPSSSSPLTPPTSSSSQLHRSSGEKLVNGRGGSGVFGVPSSSSSASVPRSVTPPALQDRRPSPARSPMDRRPPSTPSTTTSPLGRRPPPSPSSSQRAGAAPSCLQLPMPSSLSSVSSSSSNSGSLLDRKQQNGVKASSSSPSPRSHKRLSGRVFDADKHCGVQDPESKRPCTRSLTCKTHSLTHRRAVPGRTKPFDSLLAEHKGRAKEKDKEKDTPKEKEREKKEDAQPVAEKQARKDSGGVAAMSQETTSPSKPHCPNGRPLSTLKLRLANAHIPRVPGLMSSSAALPAAAAPPAPAPASNPEPSPHGWGRAVGDGARLSSDDGDVETSDDDRLACHFSAHHPRPLACCVFSSRLMGRGHYVFDRRWDRMRLALQSMVERHLNAQMWRKVPLAAESLLSLSSSVSPSLSPSATSPTPPPLLPSPSEPFSSFSSYASPGAFAMRGPSVPVSAAGKPRNGTTNAHKQGRPAREREDSVPNAKKRRSTEYSSSPSLPSSSSLSSSSSSSPNVDSHKRNGSSLHPAFLRGRGGSAAAQGRRKGPSRGGSYPGSRGEDWLSRTDGGQSHSTRNSLDQLSSTATSVPYSPSKDQTSSSHNPSGPAAYRGGGVDGKKRRSPSSYGGTTSKLSRAGGLDGLFRKGNGTGSILASGPDSPRQAKLHH